MEHGAELYLFPRSWRTKCDSMAVNNHLNPNSVLHIAIFVHLCEAFLGIELHFDLFYYLFHLKP
jgi:hypothetical protein